MPSRVSKVPLRATHLRTKWENAAYYSPPPGDSSSQHDSLNLRLSRALSWLERAEQEYKVEDFDAAFIFYWIAFNAIYGQSETSSEKKEWEMWRDYLGKAVALGDSMNVIDDTVWRVLPAKIKRILENRYVYWRYWRHRHNPAEYPGWDHDFEKELQLAKQAINERRTEGVLPELFDRLYTLRNQLLHGGAKWESSVNRAQVDTGARIMSALVPHFIDVMIEYPDAGWGAPRYPPVREKGPLSGFPG